MNQEQIDAGFDDVRRERALRSRIGEVRSAEFWRRLNPELTISDEPFARRRPRVCVDPAIVDHAKRQFLDEGCMPTPPLVVDDEIVRFRRGIDHLSGGRVDPRLVVASDSPGQPQQLPRDRAADRGEQLPPAQGRAALSPVDRRRAVWRSPCVSRLLVRRAGPLCAALTV